MTPPHLHDGLRLVSTKSAIACARIFVEQTLHTWAACTLIQEAVRVVEELVMNAVNATGTTEARSAWTERTRIEFISVRVLGFETSIRIEVWDSAPNLPILPDDGRSHVKRGSYTTPRGKVVWVELPVCPPSPGPRTQPTAPTERFRQVVTEAEVLRRVRDGLEGL